MQLQTPIGPDLPITAARQFAIDQIDTKVSADPALVTAFWDEVNASSPSVRPDITVLYCFLRFEGATFTLLEFVSGQTLEELCVAEDPASCEKVIPLFSRLLDACDGSGAENTRNRPAPERLPAGKPIQLSGFGVARAAAPVTAKLHGTMLVRPDGSWSEEILSEENGRSAAYPVLMAVYKELMGRLPRGTPLAPAQLTSFSKRELTKAPAPVPAPVLTRRATPYVMAFGACSLLLIGLFSVAHFFAQRLGSKQSAGLNLPKQVAVVEPAPSVEVSPPPEADAATPGKETLIINSTGLSRGPRLIRQIGPSYPTLARQQNISGVVKLEITVAEDGSVWAAKVMTGNPLLAQGAADAVKRWRYQPALVNGKPSSSTTEVEIKFDLDQPN
jgi:TonB family protein